MDQLSDRNCQDSLDVHPLIHSATTPSVSLLHVLNEIIEVTFVSRFISDVGLMNSYQQVVSHACNKVK